jgi:hypothetical protein
MLKLLRSAAATAAVPLFRIQRTPSYGLFSFYPMCLEGKKSSHSTPAGPTFAPHVSRPDMSKNGALAAIIGTYIFRLPNQ